MKVNDIELKLKNEMTNDGVVNKRFIHSVGVAKACVELVKYYSFDIDLKKAYVAGLLHDATKLIDKKTQREMLYKMGYTDSDEIMLSTNVWHGETAYEYVKENYGIVDEEILSAIRYHVMGRPNMTILEKIVFIADYIEENRQGVVFEKARKLAFEDIDKTILFILESQIEYIMSQNQTLISQTLKTYDYYKQQEDYICKKK